MPVWETALVLKTSGSGKGAGRGLQANAANVFLYEGNTELSYILYITTMMPLFKKYQWIS